MKTLLAVLVASATLLAYDSSSHDKDCAFRSCRSGGIVFQCIRKLGKEYHDNIASCKVMRMKSGASAYLMASTLPKVCVERTATLWLHRPYTQTALSYKAAPVGSVLHKLFFSRVSQTMVRGFIKRGGMKKDGWANALFMTPFKATDTGLPICKD